MLRLSLALQPSAAFRPSFLRPACRAASEFNFKAYNTLRAFSAFTMAPTSASEVPKWVDGLVEEHKITVFSKSYCPYCKAAISALTSLNVSDMHVEQIEDNPFCDTIQDYLKTKTGARSVPRVFINGKFFGGGDDTVEGIRSGSVQRMLQA